MTTPAEKLAARKLRQRGPRNSVPVKNKIWYCQVRKCREALGLSLRDMASAIGMGIPSVWQIEMGSDPMLTSAVKLARFFGKSIEELWPKKRKVKS